MANAFVYGTLMAPEVLSLLIKRVPPMKPAYIKGYKRYRVKGQVFPAIVRDTPEAQVAGQVLLGLNDKEFHILDVYESEEYYKETVKSVLEDGTEVDAMVYIWHDKFRPRLEPGAWDYSEWREHRLHQWTSQMSNGTAHPQN